MRVIGGKLGGRRFSPPKNNWPTRPTTDMAKEGLFNILSNRIDLSEIKALDLFGGVGSQTFELFSRGCNDITYVERHHGCLKFVKQQLEIFSALSEVRIVRSDVFKFLKSEKEQYDYIFADPPYALPRLQDLPDLIIANSLLRNGGILVIEHDHQNDFQDHHLFKEVRKYGDSRFSFFEV